MMARALYSLFWWLLLPLLPLRLWWRGRKEPGYRLHWAERLGYYRIPVDRQRPLIWLHAVSLGETRAAQSLVAGLRQRYPQHQLLITHLTATGREAAQALYSDYALIATLPYDGPLGTRRFLRHFRPAFGLILETEVWPNLCAASLAAGVPLYLLNARLSARSARGYQRFAALSRPAFARFRAIAAQSDADAERLRQLGGQAVTVCGNLKYDLQPPGEAAALAQGFRHAIGERPVLLLASSRDGEEALLLGALQQQPLPAHALLVVVPRHPQRFDEVARLLASTGHLQRRSQWDGEAPLPAEVQILLGDSLGELYAWYGCADLAIMGGSLLPYGGHNLIEAAAVGCPLLLGPHMFNFAEASQLAVDAGAARRVADPAEALQQAIMLLAEPAQRQSMHEAALAFVARHQGATQRMLALLPDGAA